MTQSMHARLVAVFGSALAGAVFISLAAAAQVVEPNTNKQTIRLEATADGRMRLSLEGPETWTIEAKTFEVHSEPDGVRFVAQPLTVQFQTTRSTSIANEFELLVRANGSLGFTIRESRRIK